MPDQVSREAKKRHVAVNMIFFRLPFCCAFAMTRMLWSRGRAQSKGGWLTARTEGNMSLLPVKNWMGCKDGDSLGEATKTGADKVGLTCMCSFPGGGVGCWLGCYCSTLSVGVLSLCQCASPKAGTSPPHLT